MSNTALPPALAGQVEPSVRLDPERLAFEDWADERWGREAYRHKSDTSGEWEAWKAATARERHRCAQICDTTPPYPFRASIERLRMPFGKASRET